MKLSVKIHQLAEKDSELHGITFILKTKFKGKNEREQST